MIWLTLLAAIWLMLAAINDCYDIRVAGNHTQIAPRLLLTTVEAGVLYLVAFFIFGRPAVFLNSIPDQHLATFDLYTPPRLVPGMFLLALLPMVMLWRFGYARLLTSPSLRRRAIIVGVGVSGRALIRTIRQNLRDYEFIGFVDDDPAIQKTYVAGLPVLGTCNDLISLVQSTGADEVILSMQHDLHDDLFTLLIECYERRIEVKPMTLLYEEVMGRVPVEHLGPQWFLESSNAKTPIFFQIFKRFIDISVALFGLMFLAILFPLIALAIYLDSPGPIFYKQERSGKYGVPFRLLKFRSMIPDAEQTGQAKWAAKNDPRITRLGRFLRRTRLDELPQVINILKGDMSIVGPRPERPQFVDQLEQQIPFYRTRLSVTPGLTGWAQVKYRYGSSVEDALIKLQYDLYYIKHQSFVLDLLIIVKTMGVVLTFKGT